MTTTRTRQVNRLRALLLTGEDLDRDLARGAMTRTRLQAILDLPNHPDGDHQVRIRRSETHRLARAIRQADVDLADNVHQLTSLVRRHAAVLLERPGIGPVSAAQAIVSFSHPGRCRNDAAFASLAGTSPIPASSGQTVRWRLNRGGDRSLNRAVHTIAHSRMISCSRTRHYVERRRAQGKTTAEIRRCLKRYITRELFRALTASMS